MCPPYLSHVFPHTALREFDHPTLALGGPVRQPAMLAIAHAFETFGHLAPASCA